MADVITIDRELLQEQAGVCVLINGRQVAVFYLPQEQPGIFAISNWDPIGEANVLSRGIVGDIQGELVVASPLYKQHFNLSNGRCLENETAGVPIYHARLEGDTAVISLHG